VTLSKLSPHRAVALLAVLAVVSALLTNFLPSDPWGLLMVGPERDRIPLLPGVYFGAVLLIGLVLNEERRPLGLAVALAATVVAWICAWKTGYEIYMRLDRYSPTSDVLGSVDARAPYLLAAAGLIAGMVGSLITLAGMSFAGRGLRTAACWTRTVSIGALAGMLLGLNGVMESMLPLFLVWQPAVAASIGQALARPGSLPFDAAAAASAPADPTGR
jgi:hypothetical protein